MEKFLCVPLPSLASVHEVTGTGRDFLSTSFGQICSQELSDVRIWPGRIYSQLASVPLWQQGIFAPTGNILIDIGMGWVGGGGILRCLLAAMRKGCGVQVGF